MSGGGSPRVLTSVANGTNASDAVNLGQLQALGVVSASNETLELAKGNTKITTIDIGSGIPSGRIIGGIKAGVKPSDAVNLEQLKAQDDELRQHTAKLGVVSGSTLALAKADANVSTVDMASGVSGGRTISGVKAGAQPSDAVNLGQLQTQWTNSLAKLQAIGVASGSTLVFAKGGLDITTIDMAEGIPAGRTISGVKAGANKLDAVNFEQLQAQNNEIHKQATSLEKLQALGTLSESTVELAQGNPKITTINVAGGIPDGRTIKGVKAGINDTDAVNFGQLQVERKEIAQLRADMLKLDAEFQAGNLAARDFTLDVKAGETVFEHDLEKRVRAPNTITNISLGDLTNKDAGKASLIKKDGRYALSFDAATSFHGVTHLTYKILDKNNKEQFGKITINVLNQASL
ncbi:Haemagluttinin domain protein [Burkholderia ambifaria]|uniref:Haemagluttinin domain protein n=1 Tax=Burkholderia ambifaria MEX-5 TaxID=396597 RepID=B1T969_9BURK|nr:Haemagluttinin domain protein [Burkholderia ambifaria]EDT39886.1 Haemagluttinin domain protein [Burkholderia ambifaria MEX-5]